MAKFSLGQRISFKTNPAIKGTVNHVHHFEGGHQFYDVIKDNGGIAICHELDLIEELSITSPWDLLVNNRLSNYQDFIVATTYYKVRNTSTNTISSLKASRTQFKPYQFKPLVKFLNSQTKRLLIADEVGLGKTIETGHIMLELAGRSLLKNTLIICTKSLQNKWQNELREKFNFEFKIYETDELKKDIQKDTNLNQKTIRGIINYEKCRNEKIIKVVKDAIYSFDLIICDEAHKLRNKVTQTHKGIRELLSFANATIFLTATPIMTDIENLYNLVTLLEPEHYFNFELFKNAINQNKPFIKALNALNNNHPLKEIADDLKNSKVEMSIKIGDAYLYTETKTVTELFYNDPLYLRAMEMLINSEDNKVIRANIQADLTDLNTLNHLYTRNRKKEVITAKEVITRLPSTRKVTLSSRERELYDEVVENYSENRDSFGIIMKKRQMSSSIIAYLSTREKLIKGEYLQGIPDTKFEELARHLYEIVNNNNQKVIIFSYFKSTLYYLNIRLIELGFGVEIIHGDVKDVNERTARIENFRTNENVKILLSSEVGSEGLDMQFCHVIINYDLPWNPMVVEQRIGRVDRVGQQSNFIHIYSFVIKDTIEERIYDRLLDRINVFKESLGDLEEILGEDEPLYNEIENLQKELYRTKLTPQQQNDKIDAIRLAIEAQKLTIKQISAELTDAVVNDLYFQDEIQKILTNNRYLTEIEIQKYLESIFRLYLTTCHLVSNSSNTYRIELPNNNKNVLFKFIEEYKDTPYPGSELEVLFRKFRKHTGKDSIIITFNQEFAYDNPQIEFVNSYHPLINAATNWFRINGFDKNMASRIAIKKERINVFSSISPGNYILAVFTISLTKGNPNNKKIFHLLHPIVIDVNDLQPRLLLDDIAEKIMAICQTNIEEPQNEIEFDPDSVNIIRHAVANYIHLKESQILDNEHIKLQSSSERTINQLKQFYDNQIKRKEDLLNQNAGIKEILSGEIDKLKEEFKHRVNDIKSETIQCSNDLISVNYLQII